MTVAEYLLNKVEQVEPIIFDRARKRVLSEEIDRMISTAPESIEFAVAKIRQSLPAEARIAFVSGIFNVVHPGHLRLLTFAAECADYLIVGVNNDTCYGTFVPHDLRLQGIRAIDCVDLALSLPFAADKFISLLKPEIVVKGSEHETLYNPEQSVVDAYGGKLLFSAGEMRFSSLELLRSEVQEVMYSTIKKPVEYLKRHAIQASMLPNIVKRFADLSVVVIGDLIVDEYITCDPLGLSREDPTIVVTPIKRDIFIGGAGIVAAHARALGAKVKYFSVVGKDDVASFARETLNKFEVDHFLAQDTSRPTTLKQRF